MASIDRYDEHRLVQAARGGDAESFRTLAELHAAGLLRAAAAWGCDRATAEDLAQETFFEAWRSLERFDGRCRLGTWLFGILRHRWLKLARRKTPMPAGELVDQSGTSGGSSRPSARLERDEQSHQLRMAVAGLPDGQRQVVELRFFAEASLDEIASALDCPLGTVKSRLHHALERLRQQKFD